MSAMTTKPVKPSHGACRLFLPCLSSSPSDGEPGGRPKPRKSSAVERDDRAAGDERQEGERRDHGVGQHVART